MKSKKVLDLIKKNKTKQKKPKREEIPLSEYALSRLERGGFVFAKEPVLDEFYLHVPADITEVSDKDLGTYLSTLTVQKNWIITLISKLEAEMLDVKESFEEAYSDSYDNAPHTNVNDKKEYAKTTKKYRYWARQKNRAEATLTMALRNLETLDNAIFLVSREVSRRTGLRDQEIRDHNISNMRR